MFEEDVLKKTTQFGALGYPLSKCLNILDLDPDLSVKYAAEFGDTTSEIYKKYQKGVDAAEFMIDSKLFEMARAGDLKALKEYEQRKKALSLKR